MATVIVPVECDLLDGVAQSDVLVAADIAGHTMSNAGKPILIVKNASGSPINVVVATPVTRDSLALADLTVAVAAGETEYIGPFPSPTFETAAGIVSFTVSSAGSVTVGAIIPGNGK